MVVMLEYICSCYYIYSYVFILVIVLCYYKGYNTQANFMWLVFFPAMVVLDGLRWETGNDWENYKDIYLNCFIRTDMRVEIGYQYLNRIIYYVFGPNYTIFLLIISLIYYYFICDSIRKYSNMPLIAFFLFYCGYLAFMGTIRQLLAFSICFYSLRFVVCYKYWRFLLCVLLASLLHNSALFFLIVAFLNRSFSLKIYVLGVLISVFVSLFGLVDLLFFEFVSGLGGTILFVDRLNDYFYSGNEYLSQFSYFVMLIPVLRRFIIVFFSYFIMEKVLVNNRYFRILFNMYYLFVIIYLLFYGSNLQILVSRLSLYLMVCKFLLIGEFVFLIKNKIPLLFVVLCVFVYGILFVNKALNESEYKFPNSLFFPYKGIFVNTTYLRTMY